MQDQESRETSEEEEGVLERLNDSEHEKEEEESGVVQDDGEAWTGRGKLQRRRLPISMRYFPISSRSAMITTKQ